MRPGDDWRKPLSAILIFRWIKGLSRVTTSGLGRRIKGRLEWIAEILLLFPNCFIGCKHQTEYILLLDPFANLLTRFSTNANAFKICFWLISYIVFEPGLLKSIQAETEFGIINGKVEIAHLLNHCPYLDAAFHETLRLTSNASSARTILAPTTVSKKVLQPGCKLLIPYRQLHFNPAVFGAEVKKFNAQRFLDNDALSRSTNYRPFGGGSTYCSGRFIARREVYAFVALVLNRFELTLQDPKQCFPRLDETTPSLGVIGPLSGHDLILNIKRRI